MFSQRRRLDRLCSMPQLNNYVDGQFGCQSGNRSIMGDAERGNLPPATQQFQIGSDTPPVFQAQPLPLEDASDGEGLCGPSPLDA